MANTFCGLTEATVEANIVEWDTILEIGSFEDSDNEDVSSEDEETITNEVMLLTGE